MIDKVEALMREVAAQAIMPRFQRLRADEIHSKGPGDLVTAADQEAEELLSAGLVALLPGSLVVGEEATAGDPEIPSRLNQPGADVWLVDPVDGTGNFAAGREPFAVMVALVQAGQTTASCILDPVSGIACTAERGRGTVIGGERAMTPRAERPAAALAGFSVTRSTSGTSASGGVSVLAGRNCAGYEYPAIVRDEQQFAYFGRLLPWDHAPGVLLVEEAGGVAWHLDGTPYDPASTRTGVLVAQNASVWHTVRTTLLAGLD